MIKRPFLLANNSAMTIVISMLLVTLTACNTSSSSKEVATNLHKFETTNHDFIIIAHRGASGYLPEHSKEAAVLAYMQGADYIEQDLVVTKDDQLIVLHDIHLETVTNVENVFTSRKRSDGRYYALDFTLAELRQLSLHERQTPSQTQVFENRYRGNAHFSITTFAEQVELIRELNRQFAKTRGKLVGWYPEIKAPEWHLKEGKDIAGLLSSELNRLELNQPSSKIFVQSFEPTSLKRLKNEFAIKVPLIQLIGDNEWNESSADYTKMLRAESLAQISDYAAGIGPWLPQVYDYETNEIKNLISIAHEHGLVVHPYTHREDASNLPNSPKEMFFKIKQAGANGLFTDQIMPYMLTR